MLFDMKAREERDLEAYQVEKICSSCFGKRWLLGSNEFEVRHPDFIGDKTE